jgi:hypothetical protein
MEKDQVQNSGTEVCGEELERGREEEEKEKRKKKKKKTKKSRAALLNADRGDEAGGRYASYLGHVVAD